MKELIYQGDVAEIAVTDFNAVVNHPDDRIRSGRGFASIQSLLGAGAMMSKMLWPQPGPILSGQPTSEEARTRAIARARHLRKELGIKGIPVLESRKVRNSFEHFDDRLDAFMAADHGWVIDRVFAGQENDIVVDGQPPLILRRIDRTRLTVSVLEDEVSIQELFDATKDVTRRASEWISAEHARDRATRVPILEP